jgi:hypothetical protein
MGVLRLSIMYDAFYNVTYVYYIIFWFGLCVVDKHIWIWRLDTNSNKYR